MANGVAITKPAAVKKTARRKAAARKEAPYKERILTPESFEKKFWEEMCVGMKAHGWTEGEFLRVTMEIRRELREKRAEEKRLGKTDEELLREDGFTNEDIERAKREGRWIDCGGKIPKPRR